MGLTQTQKRSSVAYPPPYNSCQVRIRRQISPVVGLPTSFVGPIWRESDSDHQLPKGEWRTSPLNNLAIIVVPQSRIIATAKHGGVSRTARHRSLLHADAFYDIIRVID